MHSKASWCLAVCSRTHLDHRLNSFSVAIFGLVFGAENALMAHEAERRYEENIIRKEARFDLARRGVVATETEIAKWKASRPKPSD